MKRERHTIIVEVDLDPVPGTFSTKESAEQCVQAILRESIGHYNPQVVTAPAIPAAMADTFQATLDQIASDPQAFLARMGDLLASPLGKEVAEQASEAFGTMVRTTDDEQAPDDASSIEEKP